MHTVRHDDTFRTILAEHRKVIVLFIAYWNNPCKRMYPAFKALAQQHGSKCKFITVDVNMCHDAAADVDDLPTFHAYLDETQTHAYVGTDGNELRTWVEGI